MDLFDRRVGVEKNLLHQDGTVYYYGRIFDKEKADHFYNELMNNIVWKNDEAHMFGKVIITKRKVAWYGEKPFEYTYSNNTKLALIWTSALLELKNIIEKASGETYNSCLLNLYHDGSEGMAYHSDGEKDLKEHGAIASVSLGAERKFSFKHKTTKERVDVFLEHGSLLVMKGTTQENWMHRLPPTKKVNRPRVNLTFRTIEN